MFWENIKYHLDPKNRHDIQLQKELKAELRRKGYAFNPTEMFNCYTFGTKDNGVVPILIKYIEQFDSDGCKMQYTSALGVKGFDSASEYLLTKYEEYLHPYNQMNLNIVAQTLARICDLRFLNEYLEILSKDVTIDACYLVQMLGKLKVEEAVPCLIGLIDRIAIIPEKWNGTLLEDQKYYVSQCAIEAIGKFQRKEYNQYIEKFLDPQSLSWIQYTDSPEQKQLLKTTYKEYIRLAQKAIC